MIPTKYLVLFAVLAGWSAFALSVELDGIPLNREVQPNFSISGEINWGTTVAVARLISRGTEDYAPMGSTKYCNAELEIVHCLYGKCPANLLATYSVTHIYINGNGLNLPFKPMPAPPLQQPLLVVGKVDASGGLSGKEPRFQIKRYLEPNQTNLELAGSLIRHYHGQELAKDREAYSMLELNLAAALKSAAAQVKVPTPVVAPASETADYPWLWIAGATIVLLALLLWRKSRR